MLYPTIKWQKIVSSAAEVHEQNSTAAVAMRDEIAPHGRRKHSFPRRPSPAPPRSTSTVRKQGMNVVIVAWRREDAVCQSQSATDGYWGYKLLLRLLSLLIGFEEFVFTI